MIKKIIAKIAKDIQSNIDFLTELDRKIGDSDHGNNINLGFQEFQKEVNEVSDNTQDVFKKLGLTIMSKTGGASGPLYGMSFVKASSAMSNNKNTYSLKDFKDFVLIFSDTIKSLGGAKIGDKTMLDVWGPLSDKIKLFNNDNFKKEEIINYVEELSKNTTNIKAKRGRASYLGDRSIGVEDPGSASSTIILKFLIEGISND